jgi:MinD-like ATPase involved in chromosome partitioning or flagellar assembly
VTVIALCSAKGAPGVTTLACALAAVWPRDRMIMLAECDPSGGDLAARFGISAKQGVASLALECRSSPEPASVDFRRHVQTLPGGLEVLAGPSGASAARTVDAEVPKVLDLLIGDGVVGASRVGDLILDCGRIQPGAVGQVAALAAAELALVVTRPTGEAISSTRWIAELLSRSQGRGGAATADPASDNPGSRRTDVGSDASTQAIARLVLQGDGPVSVLEAAATLKLELAAAIPTDNVGAAWLRGEPVRQWRVTASPLVRSANAIVSAHLRSEREDHRGFIEVGARPDRRLTDHSSEELHD